MLSSSSSSPVAGNGSTEGESNVGCQVALVPKAIRTFLRARLGADPIRVDAAKSAQQVVLILQFSPDAQEDPTPTTSSSSAAAAAADAFDVHPPQSTSATPFPNRTRDSLDSRRRSLDQPTNDTFDQEFWNYVVWHCGNGHVVVRYWKGGSQWWNLNRKSFVTNDLARSEMAAYRIARMALGDKIPCMLHAHLRRHDEQTNDIPDNENKDSDDNLSWAILEYVGPKSNRFSRQPLNNGSNANAEPFIQYDSYWMDSMIKVRQEFGFMEPHPRWGRVPVDQCLDYALAVLKEVIIPMHKWFFQMHHQYRKQFHNNANIMDGDSGDCLPLQEMAALDDLLRDLGVPRGQNRTQQREDYALQHFSEIGHSFHTMVLVYREAHQEMEQLIMLQENKPLVKGDTSDQKNLFDVVQMLGKCIEELDHEMERNRRYIVEHPLPYVLLHMDCQPQNIIFAQITTSTGLTNEITDPKHRLHVSSVLDWEEAAFGDLRFELLLLGRKVCANEQQVRHIWQTYQQAFNNNNAENDNSTPFMDLGPIEPWLRLETVHSLSTLLLQSMKQQQYGRSPWETKPDLWGKISREFERLSLAGWTFCRSVVQ
ncbi:hypothetical protein ACA910_005935 [Epithemia clementina (nom. ined.)]